MKGFSWIISNFRMLSLAAAVLSVTVLCAYHLGKWQGQQNEKTRYDQLIVESKEKSRNEIIGIEKSYRDKYKNIHQIPDNNIDCPISFNAINSLPDPDNR